MTETIGQNFMLLTRTDSINISAESRSEPQPPLELPVPEGADLLPLPDPKIFSSPALDVRAAIEQRRTLRKYAEDSLTLEELTHLLWCTQGVKKVSRRPATLRTVPSAGARHAFETYLLVNRVDGMQPGLYRYAAIENALLPLNPSPEITDQIALACFDQNQIRTSAVTFIWVAVTERMTWRYGQRGYRYLHLDAGHVCQNLYLSAESLDCGVCAIAAFDDDALNRALGTDGESLFPIYLGSVGKKGTGEQ
jgi:SagB-type dehydrogenase family enzyme